MNMDTNTNTLSNASSVSAYSMNNRRNKPSTMNRASRIGKMHRSPEYDKSVLKSMINKYKTTKYLNSNLRTISDSDLNDIMFVKREGFIINIVYDGGNIGFMDIYHENMKPSVPLSADEFTMLKKINQLATPKGIKVKDILPKLSTFTFNYKANTVNYSGGALRRTKRKSRTARRSKKTRNAHRR